MSPFLSLLRRNGPMPPDTNVGGQQIGCVVMQTQPDGWKPVWIFVTITYNNKKELGFNPQGILCCRSGCLTTQPFLGRTTAQDSNGLRCLTGDNEFDGCNRQTRKMSTATIRTLIRGSTPSRHNETSGRQTIPIDNY